MQAIKDAGIVLAGLTILISVQVTRIDSADSPETGSLTPQTEAARVPGEASGAAKAAKAARADVEKVLSTGTTAPIILDFDGNDLPAATLTNVRHVTRATHDDSGHWVMELPGEFGEMEITVDAAEACSEILVFIREAAEATGREALKREVNKVVQAAPCPRA